MREVALEFVDTDLVAAGAEVAALPIGPVVADRDVGEVVHRPDGSTDGGEQLLPGSPSSGGLGDSSSDGRGAPGPTQR